MFPKMILLATSTLFCAVSPFVAVSGGFGRFINPSETDGRPRSIWTGSGDQYGNGWYKLHLDC